MPEQELLTNAGETTKEAVHLLEVRIYNFISSSAQARARLIVGEIAVAERQGDCEYLITIFRETGKRPDNRPRGRPSPVREF